MEDSLKRKLPPYCNEYRDRHGTVRVYFRAKGSKKIALRGVPWTPEFMAQYEAAKAGKRVEPITTQTLRWLVHRYMLECAEYLRLDKRTKYVRRLILEELCREPVREGSDKLTGDVPLSGITPDSIEVLRDRKIKTPEAANSRLKALRQVFKWSAKKKHTRDNPAAGVSYFKTASEGWHTWTVEEVRQFEAHHPIGTKARLFLAVLLFLGVRRSDAIRLGKTNRHVRIARDGKRIDCITFTVHKGRNRKPKRLTLPILPELDEVLKRSPLGELNWLVTDLGQPFSDAGIGNKMREWCNAAGLPHCSAHGVRKAGATIAAEKGATARQLMALYGWDKLEHAEGYTRAADQTLLAESAAEMLKGVTNL